MQTKAAFIYDPDELKYYFGDHHPFNQKRLTLTIDLLEAAGALTKDEWVKPISAEESSLLRIHSPAYIGIVKALSVSQPDPVVLREAVRFGLSTEDTPGFPGMHKVTSLVAGGSITAAELVMSGQVKHALHLAGGLHHAMHGKGSGFCVYNDASIAIAYLKEKYGARVLYVDTDVHHGDGVQWSFYSDPDVCTLSIHETGKYLFPGTGGAAERGEGEGFGTSINVPVDPYTEDDSWLECLKDVLLRTITHFRPNIIVSQHGCDAHAFDPLAHIQCSMNIYTAMPALIRDLADTWCEGKWVALGGGGYDIWRVVPRAWAMLWLVMSGHSIPDRLAAEPHLQLPDTWHRKWQPHSPYPLPGTWLDDTSVWEPMPRRKEIEMKNRQTLEIATQYLPR